ncbi:MAG: tRNA (adenosine(37)-N6)-dimethylallyltransferase MiaA [Flavobacteriales bacterium]|nr:tRNA (adenosine(37)-N6)-dimethylallyltransferase MiaA [Flavobacteriales bacterium]
MSQEKILLVVLGPTASGKTDLSIRLASFFSTEIVSADSRQVFREMKIGTARPDESEWQHVPHHLLGHRSIHETYNAGIFEEEALACIASIHQKNKTAILCGGTGFYIQSVLEGFDDVPSRDEEIRSKLTQEYESAGIEFLQQKLLQLDPAFYQVAELQNPQRLIRALEIILVTGKSPLELRSGKAKDRPWRSIYIMPDLPREVLYDRINKRVDQMIEAGMENEARNLFPYRHLNALQTVGYSEWFSFFEGEISREKAIELIKQHTRNYAKRQLTWFRKLPDVHLVDPHLPIEKIVQQIGL